MFLELMAMQSWHAQVLKVIMRAFRACVTVRITSKATICYEAYCGAYGGAHGYADGQGQ